MIEIAEFLPPTPSPVWKLAKQAGVNWAVGGLPFDEMFNGVDAPWDYLPLLRMKQRYESHGFTLQRRTQSLSSYDAVSAMREIATGILSRNHVERFGECLM